MGQVDTNGPVPPRAAAELQSLSAIACFPDHLEVRLPTHHLSQCGSKQGMVVGYDELRRASVTAYYRPIAYYLSTLCHSQEHHNLATAP